MKFIKSRLKTFLMRILPFLFVAAVLQTSGEGGFDDPW